MIYEWIKFGIVAAFFAAGILTLFVSIFGTYRFDFALTRIHSAAMNDTLVLLLFIIACAVTSGFSAMLPKFVLIILIQWCTSPISSHMLAKFEYTTDEHLSEHCDIISDNTEASK
ncbi:MAG: cation:proton antiporter [Eubacteriales bacterium]